MSIIFQAPEKEVEEVKVTKEEVEQEEIIAPVKEEVVETPKKPEAKGKYFRGIKNQEIEDGPVVKLVIPKITVSLLLNWLYLKLL